LTLNLKKHHKACTKLNNKVTIYDQILLTEQHNFSEFLAKLHESIIKANIQFLNKVWLYSF